MLCWQQLLVITTHRKHFEQLKWLCLTAGVLGVDETRNVISTKQVRHDNHQQYSPTHIIVEMSDNKHN